MIEEMKEALAAVKRKAAPSGTVVAVQLSRDESKSGKYMTGVLPGWEAHGYAVALLNGEVVARTALFGFICKGVPVVHPCNQVVCTKCARLDTVHQAVWAVKKAGATVSSDEYGFDVLRRTGSMCRHCGGTLVEATEDTDRATAALAARATNDISAMETVPAFLPPKAFVVHPMSSGAGLAPEWEWLNAALAKVRKEAVPALPGMKGQTILFNPGYWVGLVEGELPELFKRHGKKRRDLFNPWGIDGL